MDNILIALILMLVGVGGYIARSVCESGGRKKAATYWYAVALVSLCWMFFLLVGRMMP